MTLDMVRVDAGNIAMCLFRRPSTLRVLRTGTRCVVQHTTVSGILSSPGDALLEPGTLLGRDYNLVND